MQRSNDGGATWEAVDNKFVYDGTTGTHQWYDGTPHPWEFKRVWHLEPSLSDPDTVYAGVEDAAMFRTTDAGASWHELPGLRNHGSGIEWQPGAGGLGLHTILIDSDERRSGCSSPSLRPARFRTDDGWRHVDARSTRAEVAVHPGPRGRRWGTASPHRHASVAAEHASTCRSTGT
jgi:hypothetical protein